MFERSAVDNATQQRRTAVPAEITLDDGTVLRGKFHLSGNRPIYEVLNGPNQFLDFEQYSGKHELIAKSAIKRVNIVAVPKSKNLGNCARANENFDPHKVLGLKQSASADDIRAAYHALSKKYHPDRYASSDLPQEVADYINTASRRINAAFDALKPVIAATRAAAAKNRRAEPVFTTGPQF